jgi:CBS domain-containing protein
VDISRAPDIGRLCQRKVISIEPDEDITKAAQLMREKHVGCLIVTTSGEDAGTRKVVGVLTDRDIVVSVVAREVDPRSLKVVDVMNAYAIGASLKLRYDRGWTRRASSRKVSSMTCYMKRLPRDSACMHILSAESRSARCSQRSIAAGRIWWWSASMNTLSVSVSPLHSGVWRWASHTTHHAMCSLCPNRAHAASRSGQA